MKESICVSQRAVCIAVALHSPKFCHRQEICICVSCLFVGLQKEGGGGNCKIYLLGYQPMHTCDVSKPSANVWNIFQASTGDFPVTSGGGEKCKIYMRGCQTMHICDVSKPSANVCEGAKQWIFFDFCNVSKIFQVLSICLEHTSG